MAKNRSDLNEIEQKIYDKLMNDFILMKSVPIVSFARATGVFLNTIKIKDNKGCDNEKGKRKG